ncbi:hypothetical protein UT300005_25250 [Clostridium sp. CTA-5]
MFSSLYEKIIKIIYGINCSLNLKIGLIIKVLGIGKIVKVIRPICSLDESNDVHIN